MDVTDPASVLDDEDLLSLWVGRVVRTHAGLEYNLSNVRQLLLTRAHDEAGDGPANGLEQLVGTCRRLLMQADLPLDLVSAGAEALMGASAANALRNRVVHDIWLSDTTRQPSEPPRWSSFRRSHGRAAPYSQPTPRDIQSVVEAHTQLARARLRISGLFMALHAIQSLSPGRQAKGTDDVGRYVALMKDAFILAANGDIEIVETT
jgi:hypothetical protein